MAISHSQMRVVSCLSCSAPADSSIVDVTTEIPEGGSETDNETAKSDLDNEQQ